MGEPQFNTKKRNGNHLVLPSYLFRIFELYTTNKKWGNGGWLPKFFKFSNFRKWKNVSNGQSHNGGKPAGPARKHMPKKAFVENSK